MSKWVNLKVSRNAQAQLDAFRQEAAATAGPKGKAGLPNAAWWYDASYGQIIEWLAMYGQERMIWRSTNGERVRQAKRKTRLGAADSPSEN